MFLPAQLTEAPRLSAFGHWKHGQSSESEHMHAQDVCQHETPYRTNLFSDVERQYGSDLDPNTRYCTSFIRKAYLGVYHGQLILSALTQNNCFRGPSPRIRWTADGHIPGWTERHTLQKSNGTLTLLFGTKLSLWHI